MTTLLDGHVHIHDCFPVGDFLDQAHRNFRTVGQSTDAAGEASYVLLLTESEGTDQFARLSGLAARDEAAGGHWRCFHTSEQQSIILRSNRDDEMFVIAGRQIVTAERLEILALGLREMPPDGQPINAVIEQVRKTDAICVLPWGFGKWTGSRGRIVDGLLRKNTDRNFFLGDNSGRLGLWSEPSEFEFARHSDIPILPGSDPLPFPRGAGAAGRFGFALRGSLDRDRPFGSIRSMLVDDRLSPEPFGELESLLPFVLNQVRMQLRKRPSHRES